jgi:hypothetical protein
MRAAGPPADDMTTGAAAEDAGGLRRPGLAQAKAGTCACIPPGQVHAYRNGSPGCRFLTITGPGPAREFFEQLDAEVTTLPPDMGTVLAVAARHGLEVPTPSSPRSPPRWKRGCSRSRPRCRRRPPSCRTWSRRSTAGPKASCTLPEAGRASADATRAIIDRLSARATRPQAHATAADPIPSTGNPPAVKRGGRRLTLRRAPAPPDISAHGLITGWPDPARAEPPADEAITTIFVVCPGL